MLIAQVSDFHLKPEGLLAYAVADTASALKKAVEHINHLAPRPQLVLMTGDLVDEGAPDAYVLLKEVLGCLIPPFVMVPGNHDDKALLRRTFPDHRYLEHAVEEDGEDYLCYVLEDFPLRLIGLDTVKPGEHGGGLGPQRMAWLEKTLASNPKRPTVVFMHHPPFASAIGHMDKEIFKGWREFHALLSEHTQVERVLCGHLHRPIFRRIGPTVVSSCPAIGMQLYLDLREDAPSTFIMEPPSLMLHLWTSLWGEETLLTHTSIIPDHRGQYSGPHPFFGVVSPKTSLRR